MAKSTKADHDAEVQKLQTEYEQLYGRPTKNTDTKRLAKMIEAKKAKDATAAPQMTPEQMTEKVLTFIDDINVEVSKIKPGEANAPTHMAVSLLNASGRIQTVWTAHTPIPLAKRLLIEGQTQAEEVESDIRIQTILQKAGLIKPAQAAEGPGEPQQIPPKADAPEAPEEPSSDTVDARDPKITAPKDPSVQ